MQHKWLSKLLGYDFTVEYCRGRENVAANALSCQMEERAVLAISAPTPVWIDSVCAKYASSEELHKLKDQLRKGELDLTKYTCHDGIFFYKGRIYIDFVFPPTDSDSETVA